MRAEYLASDNARTQISGKNFKNRTYKKTYKRNIMYKALYFIVLECCSLFFMQHQQTHDL